MRSLGSAWIPWKHQDDNLYQYHIVKSFHLLEVLDTVVICPKLLQVSHVLHTWIDTCVLHALKPGQTQSLGHLRGRQSCCWQSQWSAGCLTPGPWGLRINNKIDPNSPKGALRSFGNNNSYFMEVSPLSATYSSSRAVNFSKPSICLMRLAWNIIVIIPFREV